MPKGSTPCGCFPLVAIKASYSASRRIAAISTLGPTISRPRERVSAPGTGDGNDWPTTAAAVWKPMPLAVCASPMRPGVVAISVGKTGADDQPINLRKVGQDPCRDTFRLGLGPFATDRNGIES